MSHINGFDEWGGYMDAKITKLEEQFSAASDPYRKSNLFAGISIFVNGRTNPSADELKYIMMTHGGTYHHYERTHTTYIVAENLPDVKVRQMQNAKKNILSAKWVVDCVQKNRLIDYAPYLLYTNHKTTQPRLEFDKIIINSSNTSSSMCAINDNREEITEENSKIEVLKANLEALRKQYINNNTDDKKIVTKTAKDKSFLTEFYSNSRLHHIATLGAGFKQYITNLRENGPRDFTMARFKLKQKLANIQPISPTAINENSFIMHIDMDCFFVSVGLRKHKHLRNQPVAVTHSRNGGGSEGDVAPQSTAVREAERELWLKRQKLHVHDKVFKGFDKSNYSLSEISSCSYEARKCGIKNGMFVGQALKLCPNLQTIPYDFEGYKEVAQLLYDTITQYTLDIEAVSCDEMFVDLTSLLHDLQTTPMQLVKLLRQEVRDSTACPCSAGVGPNKLLARMATKRAKPDGQFIIMASEAETFMAPMPITDLPGVGGSTAYALKKADVNTCGELLMMSLPSLQMIVGKKSSETLKKHCRGIDNRPLTYVHVRKSISAELNYGIRFKEQYEVDEFLVRLSDEVHARLMEIKRRTKCINLKIMIRAKDAPVDTAKYMGHGVCDSFSKSTALNEYTNNKLVIRSSVLSTMKAMAVSPCELRGIGIQLTKLDEPSAGTYNKHGIEQLFKRAAEKQKLNQSIRKVEVLDNNSKNKTKRIIKKTPNVINMLKDAGKKQKTECRTFDSASRKTDISLENNCENCQDISSSVKQLQELEILYTVKKQNDKQQSGLNIINTIPIEMNNVFKKTNFESEIISWIQISDLTGPCNTDVAIIINNAKNLIQEDQSYYYQLYSQINWLCRLLGNVYNSNACHWHEASKQIRRILQEELILHNGLPFLIPDTITCDKCKEQ